MADGPGTENPPCNRKGRAGNPPPKGARASALPDKTVGDFLGHASPSATAAYATIDLASLRPVADIGLKELLNDTA